MEIHSRSLKNKESSVAWFKLAELISRGEKEKALNLYRLLAHSFDDRAYVLQIEGDILWAFEDDAAVERYNHAALLYKKEQKTVSAIALYEHLITLQPSNHEYLCNLIELYAKLDWREKLKDRFRVLLDLLEDDMVSRDEVSQTIKKILPLLSSQKSIDDFMSFIEGEASFFVKDAQQG